MVDFLRDNPYGLKLDELVHKTVNEVLYSGSSRQSAVGESRSEPSRLSTTRAEVIPLEQAQASHEAETVLPVHDHGTANALALWFSAEPRRHRPLRWTWRSSHPLGDDDGPTEFACTLTPGMAVRARVKSTPARPTGTWTSWAIASYTSSGTNHDRRAISRL